MGFFLKILKSWSEGAAKHTTFFEFQSVSFQETSTTGDFCNEEHN